MAVSVQLSQMLIYVILSLFIALVLTDTAPYAALSLSLFMHLFGVFYYLRMMIRSTVGPLRVNCWIPCSNEAAAPTGWDFPRFTSIFV